MRIFKLYTAVVLLICVALSNWSCVPEDDTTRQQTSIFYLIDPLPDTVYLKGQQSLTFEIESSDGLNADKIEEVTFYKSLEVPVTLGSENTIKSTETFLTKTSTVPGELTITIQELINDVVIEGFLDIDPLNPTDTSFITKTINTEDEIPAGSKWNIRWEVRSEGKTLSPADTTEMKFQCESSMEGRYLATNSFCETTPLELMIIKDTISGDQSKYIIPDLTANQLAICAGEGIPISITVTESCGNIEPRQRILSGLRWIIIDGKWNSSTNILTIRWTDTFSLNGTVVTSTFVRQ